MTDWRERLRAVIKRKGLKQYLVAQDAGISNVTLTRMLTNPKSNPSLSTILRVAQAIDEPVSALLGEPLLSVTDAQDLQRAMALLETLLARGAK